MPRLTKISIDRNGAAPTIHENFCSQNWRILRDGVFSKHPKRALRYRPHLRNCMPGA